MKMKAAVLAGPGRTEIAEIDIPSIGEEEVLIRVSACGVCASELQPWKEGAGWIEASGDRPIFGHEPVGVIEAMGRSVQGFRIGDKVTGLIQHAFAQYTKADYRRIVHVPDGLEDIESLGEPLSCLLSGAERTPVSLGDDVAVVGAGFMGLGFLQLMRLKGAGRLIAVDTRDESLEHARAFGADLVYKPADVDPAFRVTEWAHMDAGVKGVPIAVEATGTAGGLQLAGDMAGVHGTLSVVGYHQSHGGQRGVNMELWNWKAITIVNAHERRQHVHMRLMEAGLKLIAAGLFNMKDLVTHVYRLDEVDRAYEAMQSKPSGFIKSVIRVD